MTVPAVPAAVRMAWETDAEEQIAVLLARDPAAHAALDDMLGGADLLEALRGVGAGQLAETLVNRQPARKAPFYLFRRLSGHAALYKFGREHDGSPARAWGWDDLD